MYSTQPDQLPEHINIWRFVVVRR